MGSLLVKLLAKFFAGKSYLWNSRESLCPNIVTELYLRNFLRVSLTCETVVKPSVQSWKTWELDPLTRDWTFAWNKSRKHPENMFFTQKKNSKIFEKHGWYKSPPKANKETKNLFDLIHIWLSTHTSHLNMYKHTNEIGIHWTFRLVCCVWGSSMN